MTNATPTTLPFKPGWYSFDLGTYRPCDGTYCFYEYDSIPLSGEPNEDLAWLGPDEGAEEDPIHRKASKDSARFDAIVASAAQLGLTLPPSFLKLMAAPGLQDRIPSCTACYFELSEKIVPCPASEQGYIIRFLNDQQDVLLWYLYLTPAGEHCVLVSPYALDDLKEALTDVGRQNVLANTYVCAPSFAAFIYRFWLENVLWFKVSGGENSEPLTEEEQRYLAHYKP